MNVKIRTGRKTPSVQKEKTIINVSENRQTINPYVLVQHSSHLKIPFAEGGEGEKTRALYLGKTFFEINPEVLTVAPFAFSSHGLIEQG